MGSVQVRGFLTSRGWNIKRVKKRKKKGRIIFVTLLTPFQLHMW